jgi:hypothetical protein
MLGGFGLNGATTFELRNYDTTSTIGPGNVLNFIVDYQII